MADGSPPLDFLVFERIVQMRTKSFLSVVLFFLVVAGTRSLQAQARETDRDMAQETTSKLSKNYVAPFGVPLAPPIYLINFLLLYRFES